MDFRYKFINLYCILITFLSIILGVQLLNLRQKGDYGLKVQDEVLSSIVESFKLNGKEFCVTELKNLNGQIVNIKERLHQKPSLILIYSSLNCQVCVKQEMQFFNKLYDKISGKINIIAICHTAELSLLRQYVRINSLKFSCYWDENNRVTTALGLKHTPAVLVIDKNLTIVNSLLPIPTNPKFSELFYTYAVEKIE